MLIKFLLAIVIIASLVAGGLFIKAYFDENAAGDKIDAQIKDTQKSIMASSNQMQSLQSEIDSIARSYSQTQAALDAEKGVLPERSNPNRIVEEILTQGKTSRVIVIPLSTQDWAKIKIGIHDYSVFRISIEVNGLEDDVIKFIRGLDYTPYKTLVIENVSLSKDASEPSPTPTPTGTQTATPTPTPSPDFIKYPAKANLSLAIYAK